jgi:hypothetical protein
MKRNNYNNIIAVVVMLNFYIIQNKTKVDAPLIILLNQKLMKKGVHLKIFQIIPMKKKKAIVKVKQHKKQSVK